MRVVVLFPSWGSDSHYVSLISPRSDPSYVFLPMCSTWAFSEDDLAKGTQDRELPSRDFYQEGPMLITKNLDAPDETRSFEHGELTSVSLGGVTFARAAFRPGWRRSTDIKPLVGTDSCQVSHQAIVISGCLMVKMDTGEERELAAGDAHVVGPGHCAWVVGDEPCVILDFTTESQKSSGPMSQSTSGSASGASAGVPTHVAACPCGVTFQIESDEALDHLVAAVQEHALGSHDHQVTREHILGELRSPSVA
jgi:hypothetical protein